MIPQLTADGFLPPGRYPATLRDVHGRFVLAAEFTKSEPRIDIWNRFTSALDLLKELPCRYPMALLGGSFTTSKLDPGDIDASVLVDRTTAATDELRAELDQRFNLIQNDLDLDVFPVWWVPTNGAAPPNDTDHPSTHYLLYRGYWDDWWPRYVPKPERNPFQRHHAFPRRGYLEVTIDGFQ